MNFRKKRLLLLRSACKFVLLGLGSLSIVFLIGCFTGHKDKTGAVFSGPSIGGDPGTNDTIRPGTQNELPVNKDKVAADSSRVKNIYDPGDDRQPVAYGTFPAEYKTITLPDSLKK